MDIKSLTELKFNQTTQKYNLFIPSINYSNGDFREYTVQKGESMRIDQVMLSMYNDDYNSLQHIDVILYLNGIDNPINIVENMVMIYPPDVSTLDSYRATYNESDEIGQSIKEKLSPLNKTTRKDSNRSSFINNDYSLVGSTDEILPPVVLSESKQPVRVENGKIKIGGLN